MEQIFRKIHSLSSPNMQPVYQCDQHRDAYLHGVEIYVMRTLPVPPLPWRAATEAKVFKTLLLKILNLCSHLHIINVKSKEMILGRGIYACKIRPYILIAMIRKKKTLIYKLRTLLYTYLAIFSYTSLLLFFFDVFEKVSNNTFISKYPPFVALVATFYFSLLRLQYTFLMLDFFFPSFAIS